MTIKDAMQQCNNRPLTDFYSLKRKGGSYICPICQDASSVRSGCLSIDKNTNRVTCFGSGMCFGNGSHQGTDTVGALQILNKCDLKTALSDAGYTIDGTQNDYPLQAPQPKQKPKEDVPVDYTEFLKECMTHLSETDYYRGLSVETLKHYGVGFCKSWNHPKAPNSPKTPRLIIPTSKYSYLARLTGKAKDYGIEQQYAKMKVGNVNIFNSKILGTSDSPIFVTEGEIDAMSIYEMTGCEAIGIGSVSMLNKFGEMLKTIRPKKPLILLFDNDMAGKNAYKQAKNMLDNIGIQYIGLDDNKDIYGYHKDINEAMNDANCKESLIENLKIAMESAETVYNMDLDEAFNDINSESVENSLQGFLDRLQEKQKGDVFIPTGFKALDRTLNGGLSSGLYVIGALSSAGKTTFCLQMADQIAQAGRDVIIFSLEMARDELMSKSISRLTYQIERAKNRQISPNKDGSMIWYAKDTVGILNSSRFNGYSEEEQQLIMESINEYNSFGSRVYIKEAMGDVGATDIIERVKKHIEAHNVNPTKYSKKPVVIIDYLQILKPLDMKLTDKQNTDKAVFMLKQISRDYDIPIVVISSFNRDSYSSGVTMASFKESGAIEYSSDVLIGLQLKGMAFDVDTDKKEIDRKIRVHNLEEIARTKGKAGESYAIEVKVLKNRNGYKSTHTFNFNPKYNNYDEVD